MKKGGSHRKPPFLTVYVSKNQMHTTQNRNRTVDGIPLSERSHQRSLLLDSKQTLQYTGLSVLGWNFSFATPPHSLQVASKY